MSSTKIKNKFLLFLSSQNVEIAMLLACCYGNDKFDTAISTQYGDSLANC